MSLESRCRYSKKSVLTDPAADRRGIEDDGVVGEVTARLLHRPGCAAVDNRQRREKESLKNTRWWENGHRENPTSNVELEKKNAGLE